MYCKPDTVHYLGEYYYPYFTMKKTGTAGLNNTLNVTQLQCPSNPKHVLKAVPLLPLPIVDWECQVWRNATTLMQEKGSKAKQRGRHETGLHIKILFNLLFSAPRYQIKTVYEIEELSYGSSW